MALEAYINGKSAEELVKGALREIGCYVDDYEKFKSDWASLHLSGDVARARHLFSSPFSFQSQKGIKKDWMQFGVDKIPDFQSANDFIEVKSVSNTTRNKNQSNKKLVGEIIYEYKQYTSYFEYKNKSRHKESVYYVIIGPCDKELILSHLEDSRN